MASIQLKVTPTEGDPISVPITPKVMVLAERHFKKPIGQLFTQDSASIETMAWMAWEGLRAAGYEIKTFDLWLDGISSIEPEDSEQVPLHEA